jgi:hypothetical protein
MRFRETTRTGRQTGWVAAASCGVDISIVQGHHAVAAKANLCREKQDALRKAFQKKVQEPRDQEGCAKQDVMMQ